MNHSMKYDFIVSQLTHIEDVKETEKTKISIVFHQNRQVLCRLRICKNRDLSSLCAVLQNLRNPNLLLVHDYVYENGNTYILEENLDGQTVEEVLEKEGVFSEARTAEIIIEVCKALEDLHRQEPPVIHNDINISNIMICEDRRVKLIDFDISRLYKKGQSQNTVLFGTEEYASPEHFGYGQSEPRTDIYCLGVTMHKMLTDRGLSSEHRMTYNGKLKGVLTKCLAFDPKNRYNSVRTLRNELERFLRKKPRRIRKLCGVLIAVVLAVNAVNFVNGFYSTLKELVLSSIDSGEDPTELYSDYSDPESGDEPIGGNSSAVPPLTTVPSQEEIPTGVQANDSRDTACAIDFNVQYADTIEETGQANWYAFTTSTDLSTYRIGVSTIDSPTNTLFPYLSIAVFDTIGIKLEEFDIWSTDEYSFIDLHLKEDTEYFLKVYLGDRFTSGGYELCVGKMVCDAGIDKDSATEITLGAMHNATLNSILSDWYVFRVPEAGKYTFTIHNIDVGCDIYFSLQQPGSAGTGMCIANEDNYSGNTLSLQEGDQIYFEIYAYAENPNANGSYIIAIEKSK